MIWYPILFCLGVLVGGVVMACLAVSGDSSRQDEAEHFAEGAADAAPWPIREDRWGLATGQRPSPYEIKGKPWRFVRGAGPEGER